MKNIILIIASVSGIKHISDYTAIMNSPEDVQMIQTTWGLNSNDINDKDGDGVEDNIDLNSGQLDKYFFPNYFATSDGGVFNTRYGNMPGETQKEFDVTETEPEEKW